MLLLAALAAAGSWRAWAPAGGPGQGITAAEIQAAALPPAAPPAAAAPSPREIALRLFEEGYALTRAGNPRRAELPELRDLFERSVAADPGFGPAWAWLAIVHALMADPEVALHPAESLQAAERAAERALALAPAAADTHAARGAVPELRPDRLEDGLSAYQPAVALDANQHRARGKVGWLLIRLGRAEEAESHLRTSIQAAEPEHRWTSPWHFQLGLARLLLGREEHGAEHFRRSLCSAATLYCDCCGVRTLHLAGALALDGQVEEARRLVDEVRQRRPGITAATVRQLPTRSHHPTYPAQRERLFEGLALAGLPDRQSGSPEGVSARRRESVLKTIVYVGLASAFERNPP